MSINLFLENKGHGNPRACVRGHIYLYACSKPMYASFMHAYTYMSMRTHARVPKTMKGKFFYIKSEILNESHIVWEPFQTPIFKTRKKS